MILQCQSLSEFVPIRVASWLVSSLRSEMPYLPIPPSWPLVLLPLIPSAFPPFVSWCLRGPQSILQNKPNSQNYKTSATSYIPRIYHNIPLRRRQKKQTQSNPIPATQYAIRDTQHAIRKTNPIYPGEPGCRRDTQSAMVLQAIAACEWLASCGNWWSLRVFWTGVARCSAE